ncbi:LOW QUALITY PROTEIN: peroxisomal succinyl-coenzyme A thioesterase-like [Orycteropus afer afer]|uniref:LOW QUALITY PROTEIN: peroxisomal succinyl-coenzyme A thioesterase-like n=1 Tax=Orycteropus afer afer TaxID=1230840 RepID=A0A8B6ZWT4_ORYAF|nr:LOW QUALITY PROTEIN: peroxisomal succinyl-coenzyme A thioesterase-like [Orycteropus afer afer]
MTASAPAILRASWICLWLSESWLPRPPQLGAGGLVSCTPARMAATVIVEPAGRCCWDEPVRILVRGLAREQWVTLRASLRDEKGTLFRAHARYRADRGGELDLTRTPALGGSFVGLEPMGLIWALEPEKPFWRFLKKDVQTPFAVELEVLEGHEPEPPRVLGRTVHERYFLRPGVRREPVRAARVRATLFLPPGPGPFPGIIDIFGLGGGLLEYRASLMAGHGFATLALAYYEFEDLPKTDGIIHLEYFEEALHYMLQHPKVKGPGIGLLGNSLGANICLSIASFLENISATVSINGSGFSANRRIQYKQIHIPPFGYDLRRIKVAFSGILDIVDIQNDVIGGYEHPCMIPVEKAQGPILFIVGQDDHNWRSEYFAHLMSERLQAHGKKKPQIISYPGTGHYIEPPYFPMCPASLHSIPNKPVIWGGEPRPHSKAQVDAWKQILTFFSKYLGDSPKL